MFFVEENTIDHSFGIWMVFLIWRIIPLFHVVVDASKKGKPHAYDAISL